MKAFENYIKQFPHYKSGLIEDVLHFLSIKNIEAGAYFLRQGKTCRDIAFIEKGLMRLYYLNDGKEITTTTLACVTIDRGAKQT